MKKNYLIVSLIFITFFVISFLTNIMGPIIPDIIKSFDLSYFMVAFLPFSFFIAYLMSIPAGMLIEKYREKKIMSAAFLVAATGAFIFALIPAFNVAILSLFLIGFGMAMLQVAINPLLRTAGGEAHFAFNSVLAQLFFGGASFLSPQVYSYLVKNLQSGNIDSSPVLAVLSSVVPEELPWISLYWIFAVISLFMVIVIALVKLPKVELKEDEKTGAWETIKQLLKKKTVILYFIGIFAYVGTEQGIANWISEFLSKYHGYDPQTTGADTVSYYWGLLTVGCVLGLVLLKLFDSKIVLRFFTFAAMGSLAVALFAEGNVSLYFFPATGFFLSVMWSIVFSLGLNSLDKHHGSLSGILCTGIIGGAIVPLIIGSLADLVGLRFGMIFIFVTLGYILSISFWANPLIKNETIFKKVSIVN
ncbi:MAG: sugar MFS transporter [Ignavibacteriaceae bacterium]